MSDLETEIFRWFNGLPEGIYGPVWVVMQLGNVLAVPLAAVVALVMRRWWLSAAIMVSGLATWVVAKVIKEIVERGRPAELLADVVLRGAPASGHGYISGHAAVVAAIATVVTPCLGPAWRAVLWALVAIACLARIYVGAHLVLDAVGGAAVGVGLGTLPWLARSLLARRTRPAPAA